MGTPGKLAHIDRDEIVERIANGAIGSHIAADLQVSKGGLYRHLASHPQYQIARRLGMEVRIDQAEDDLRTADEFTLARAREVWRAIIWRAEREHAGIWGNRTQVSVSVDVSDSLREISERKRAALVQSSIEGIAVLAHDDSGDALASD